MDLHPSCSRFLALCASLLLLSSPASSQRLSARVGFGYGAHYENVQVGQIITKPIVPSLGVFFDNSFVIGSDLTFIPGTGHTLPIFRVSYEGQSLSFAVPNAANALGTSLGIRSVGLIAGIGITHGEESHVKILNCLYAGYIFKSYEGESRLDANTMLTSRYDKGRALRIGTGMHIAGILPERLSIAWDASYDFGTVRRGRIDLYRDGRYVSSLAPTGDLVLPDNILTIQIGVCYDFQF